MPDLTLEYRYICPSVRQWYKTVKGTSGSYEVRYGYQSRGDYEYGWSCTCPQFKFRKACKHIEAVKGERCAWNEEAFCGGGAHAPDDHKCPNCGDNLEVIKVGV